MSEKIQKKMIRTASMGVKVSVILLCFVSEATTGKGSTGATVQVQLVFGFFIRHFKTHTSVL